MGYFPMCVDLTDRLVYLVGGGPQIREKEERLRPFGARLVHLERLTEEDLKARPAFVVAGDLEAAQAEEIAALCAAQGVALNVVDVPRLCTFCFPSLIAQGDLTISISTGGKSPGAAAYLKGRMEKLLPQRTEEILDWLAEVRMGLRAACPSAQRAKIMREITASAFEAGAPLSEEEIARIMHEQREA